MQLRVSSSPFASRTCCAPMLPDPQDDMVLETAVNGAADVIVTLNRRHFVAAAPMFAVTIALPAEALARVEKRT